MRQRALLCGGWDHPAVQEDLCSAAKKAKEYGVKHKLKEITTLQVEMSKQRMGFNCIDNEIK